MTDEKPKFIASQGLLIRDCDGRLDNGWLDPPNWNSDKSLESSEWNLCEDKIAFIKQTKRICLVGDAGIGKTTFLRWAEYQFSQDDSKFPIYCHLDELPDTRREFNESLCDLVQLRVPTKSHDEILTQLNELMEAGSLILLIDGLDQIDSDEQAVQKLRRLGRILKIDARSCNAIVASRPYTIQRYWRQIFELEEWTFASPSPFSHAEMKAYLGQRKYEVVDRLGSSIPGVARSVALLNRISSEQLATIQTPSDIHWKTISAMLHKAFESYAVQRARLSFDDALWLLSALAFEMILSESSSVSPKDMREFQWRMWERSSTGRAFESHAELRQKIVALGKLNEFLEHSVFRVNDVIQLTWMHRSIQEYFAAIWISRFAEEDELDTLFSKIRDQGRGEFAKLDWVLRFAVESSSEVRRDLRWLKIMKELFRPGDGTSEGTFRPCELMFRGWSQLSKLSGERSRVGMGARQVIKDFRDEFRGKLLSGDRGEEAKKTAEELLKQFVLVPPHGDPPFHLKTAGEPHLILRKFSITKTVVSQKQFQLFAPKLEGGDDNLPAVEVNFYDAWAFAIWLGAEYRLPNEWEWEFAMRGGQATRYWWGDEFDPARANVSSDHAAAVDSLPTNPFGIHNALGNVWEWVSTMKRVDPAHPFPQRGVLRGGSYRSVPAEATAETRWERDESEVLDDAGFRVIHAEENDDE